VLLGWTAPEGDQHGHTSSSTTCIFNLQEVVAMFLRFDPFRDLDRLTQQLSQQPLGRPSVMPMDAYRDGDRFVVHFDLPGIEPDGLDVTVDENVLTVTAHRTWQPSETMQVLAAERPAGTMQRQVYLSEGLNTGDVEARYDNGVLTVAIPVAEEAKPRKIEISSGHESKAVEAPAA
jgi:HSP20 family protein